MSSTGCLRQQKCIVFPGVLEARSQGCLLPRAVREGSVPGSTPWLTDALLPESFHVMLFSLSVWVYVQPSLFIRISAILDEGPL